MLFSLTCPERVSVLTKLDLHYCHILPEGVVKGARAIHYQILSSHVFPSSSKLCPVETLRQVIPSSKPDLLFL